MKLKSSVEILQQQVDTLLSVKRDAVVRVLKSIPAPKNTMTRLRWDIWWFIQPNVREDIIANSIPKDEWVGGYPPVTDEHINTLLTKVLPDSLLTDLIS